MIEQLIDMEESYGKPKYSKATERIIKIRRLLESQLNQEGCELVDQLACTYVEQSLTLIKEAFINGFCTAAEIALEILQHKSQ